MSLLPLRSRYQALEAALDGWPVHQIAPKLGRSVEDVRATLNHVGWPSPVQMTKALAVLEGDLHVEGVEIPDPLFDGKPLDSDGRPVAMVPAQVCTHQRLLNAGHAAHRPEVREFTGRVVDALARLESMLATDRELAKLDATARQLDAKRKQVLKSMPAPVALATTKKAAAARRRRTSKTRPATTPAQENAS